jgi:hypothetical protein
MAVVGWTRLFVVVEIESHGSGDMLAVSIMMKTIKIKKTLLEVLLRDASG